MRRTETPEPIWIKFGMVVDIPDVVTHKKFCDHRLRGFWVAGGQISPSPTDFHRRPYNSRTTVRVRYDTIIRDAIFNVRSKADMSRLKLPHGDDN